jgi:uncharacterized phiE125 gp8 family phage protein
MALVLVTPAAAEPISVAEAKAHLRLDGTADDVLIASLILTSRLHIEAALGLALITQGWKLVLDRWPKIASIALPIRPVQDVTAVRVLAADGTPEVVSPAGYFVDGENLPPRLVRQAISYPEPGRAAAGIEIAFTAGYGDVPESVPEPIRHALLLLVAHWYEHRDPIEIGAPETAIPRAVSELLMPYRVPRL